MLWRKGSRSWACISNLLLSYIIAAKISPKLWVWFSMILEQHLSNILIWFIFFFSQEKIKFLQRYLEIIYNVLYGNLTARNQHSGIKLIGVLFICCLEVFKSVFICSFFVLYFCTVMSTVYQTFFRSSVKSYRKNTKYILVGNLNQFP